jgi:hypothetical protein
VQACEFFHLPGIVDFLIMRHGWVRLVWLTNEIQIRLNLGKEGFIPAPRTANCYLNASNLAADFFFALPEFCLAARI